MPASVARSKTRPEVRRADHGARLGPHFGAGRCSAALASTAPTGLASGCARERRPRRPRSRGPTGDLRRWQTARTGATPRGRRGRQGARRHR